MTHPEDEDGKPTNAHDEQKNLVKSTPEIRVDSDSEAELTPDELALRRLLHDAVRDLEPSTDALGHLRRAVPARRAHRRQLTVGAAAACLLALVAVPAVLHVTDTASSGASTTAAAPVGGTNPSATPTRTGPAGQVGGTGGRKTSPSSGSSSGGSKHHSGGGSGSTGDSAAPPACTSADLGGMTAYTGSATASGSATGYFKVTNVSSAACLVSGSGTVTVSAQGSAQASGLSVAAHIAGDGTGLPDTGTSTLTLAAGAAYEVDFAWVPASSSGTTDGCAAASSPTPTDTATDGSTSGTTDSGTTGTTTQSSFEDATPASVLVGYTPSGGGTSTSTTVSNACAGTVYTTGLLSAT